MTQIRYIGIAEMGIGGDPEVVFSASNLGSCLGVSIYDPQTKLGGLVHCLLPLSASDPEKARARPCMYVDSGVATLLNELLAKGCNRKSLEIVVAGGSSINDRNNAFEIGKRNFTALRKLLWKNNLLMKAYDIGGDFPRTIILEPGSGRVRMRAQGKEIELTNQKNEIAMSPTPAAGGNV